MKTIYTYRSFRPHEYGYLHSGSTCECGVFKFAKPEEHLKTPVWWMVEALRDGWVTIGEGPTIHDAQHAVDQKLLDQRIMAAFPD